MAEPRTTQDYTNDEMMTIKNLIQMDIARVKKEINEEAEHISGDESYLVVKDDPTENKTNPEYSSAKLQDLITTKNTLVDLLHKTENIINEMNPCQHEYAEMEVKITITGKMEFRREEGEDNYVPYSFNWNDTEVEDDHSAPLVCGECGAELDNSNHPELPEQTNYDKALDNARDYVNSWNLR